MSFDTLHQKLGHPGEDRVRATAKIMGFKLIEPETVCEACANAESTTEEPESRSEPK